MADCEICQKKKAKIEITRVINSKTDRIFVCEECAKVVGFICHDNPEEYSIAKLLSNIVSFKRPRDRKLKKQICKECGFSLSEILDTKTVGCPECYIQFDKQIESLFSGFPDHIRHKGRVPENLTFYKNYLYSLDKLKTRLGHAVEREDFESAQQIKKDIEILTESNWYNYE
ncbi:MAG: hypothetical protein JXR70_10035 [Spirochaetales bacterium]|nr:hypothetical protein [Spirochaetales bacterium]